MFDAKLQQLGPALSSTAYEVQFSFRIKQARVIPNRESGGVSQEDSDAQNGLYNLTP